MGTIFGVWTMWHFAAGAAVIVALVVMGTVVAPWVRRHFHPSSIDASMGGPAFDINSLDRMHREGQLTDEEFRTLRRAALGLDFHSAKTDNSASSAPLGGDDDGSDGADHVDADEQDCDKE